MTTLLAQALEKVETLSPEDQNFIGWQILNSLPDEAGSQKRSTEKADVIERMAQEALEEHQRGETIPLIEIL